MRALALKTPLIFRRDSYLQSVKLSGERNLARQARGFGAVIAAFEQIVFIFADRRKLVSCAAIDMDVARRARTASAAQREQFVKAIVADGFHHGQAIFDFDFARLAFAIGDDQLWHEFHSSWMIERKNAR